MWDIGYYSYNNVAIRLGLMSANRPTRELTITDYAV